MMEYSRRQTQALKLQRNALERVASTDDGRVVLRMILDMSGVYEPRTSRDPVDLAHNEGRRAVGLGVIAALNEIDPQLFAALVRDTANDMTRAKVGQETSNAD